ncbi:MAG TPA: response regulator transcription factor [Baekduia sp.]|nr:response regulator transcription factor [Baekduia sp.]
MAMDRHASSPAHPVRVVLCDDVPALRTLARYVLEEHGEIEVVGEAGDARRAVELAGAEVPDAVLLDLSLPGMDGLQAIPLLRKVAPDAVVVVFSGFEADRMREPVLAQGAAAYIEKGAELTDVRQTLLEAVHGRRRVAC